MVEDFAIPATDPVLNVPVVQDVTRVVQEAPLANVAPPQAESRAPLVGAVRLATVEEFAIPATDPVLNVPVVQDVTRGVKEAPLANRSRKAHMLWSALEHHGQV